MKKLIYPALGVLVMLGSAFVSVKSLVDYKIKDGHSIAFKSKDPSGTFSVINGTVKFDEEDLAGSKFDLKIPVSSIVTGNAMQNKKAQTDEWFSAKKFPDIKFVSTKIAKSGTNYDVTGNITMKGVSKEKKITCTLTKSGSDLTFKASFTVNRMDFKVGKKSDAVPDNMNMTISLPITKK